MPSFRTLLDEVNDNGWPDGFEDLEISTIPHTKCNCGRTVTLDMMTDLDNPAILERERVPAAVRSAFGRGPVDRRFVCDACWYLWYAVGLMDGKSLRRAMGDDKQNSGRL